MIMRSRVERANGRRDATGKVILPMRKSSLVPLFALLLGGCPFEDDSLSTIPGVVPGAMQPDERGVSVLARTIDERWPQIDAMAMSDNYLFLGVNWHGLYKMPKFGGPIETIDADETAVFDRLATNGSDIVWQKVTFDSSDYPFFQFKRQSVDGGPTQVVFTTRDQTWWKANRGFFVSVTSDSDVVLTTQPLAGGGPPITRVLYDFNTGPGSFDWGLDDTSVYVARDRGDRDGREISRSSTVMASSWPSLIRLHPGLDPVTLQSKARWLSTRRTCTSERQRICAVCPRAEVRRPSCTRRRTTRSSTTPAR